MVTSDARVIPNGKVSLKSTLDNRSSLGLGLVMMKVSVLVSFARMVLGLKFLSIVGGRTATRLALADPLGSELVPPSVV